LDNPKKRKSNIQTNSTRRNSCSISSQLGIAIVLTFKETYQQL